ncbi:alpha/beta hydrolase [Actinomycetospora sp. CA-084318]|uniref:alpha/beta hydrolase n=1 Tax=Actinomycetospora sp. CA-084318 TaxID=3239892 RepID=UPI003D97B43C
MSEHGRHEAPRRYDRPFLRATLLAVATAAVLFAVSAVVQAGGLVFEIELTDAWFGALLVALVLVAVVALLLSRRRAARVLAVLGLVVALLLGAAAAVNLHFDYYRTLGEAVGAPARDQVTIDTMLREDADPGPGVVAPVPIPASASGFQARPAMIYVPSAFFTRPRPQLPVIMLLHGTPGTPQDWINGGRADTIADAFAAAHGGVSPILVMPDINGSTTADTECVDGPAGNAETYLTQDVPDYVLSTFRTRPTGSAWAVAGLSEGGSCAVMLALRHPNMFHTFGDYAGLEGPRSGDTNAGVVDTVTQLFGGSQAAFDAHEPTTILGTTRFPALGGWFEVGTADPDPAAAQALLVPAARRAGIATCSVLVPNGGHTFDVFSAAFERSLPWMSSRLGIPTTGAACPQQ